MFTFSNVVYFSFIPRAHRKRKSDSGEGKKVAKRSKMGGGTGGKKGGSRGFKSGVKPGAKKGTSKFGGKKRPTK